MTAQDVQLRRAALTRLALATRERLPDDRQDREALFKVYLDDTAQYDTTTYVEACRRLESRVDWFPKKHEVIAECQAIVKQKAEAREAQRLDRTRQLTGPGIDPEKWLSFKDRVNSLLEQRRMQ